MPKKDNKSPIFLNYKKDNWISSIIKHPELILPVTFFLLCLFGAIMLLLPVSTNSHVTFLDSLFTSVSAVCVTGLTVLDVGKVFNNFGQFILLFLIQTGGLGIMSISSIIFILLGKRMSLNQEKTVKNIFDADSQEEIRESLIMIFKYTFVIEFVGMIILTMAFLNTEHSILYAIKTGVFTSVSAFCNAGFFLKSTNLITYSNNPIILYTVSFLIILGGISPAIAILLPKWLQRKKLPPLALIVFNTTIVLLLVGTIVFLISENHGALAGMNIFDKINNAWFQSATTRTAGFNSVDLSGINTVTYILMIGLMIIGGSPGGTAGGIKTGVVGIFFLTSLNNILGKDNIIRNKNITYDTVQKGLTLVFIYMLILAISILTLLTTQSVSPTKLIFEATSALGTVGLSMGITNNLDEVGRVIIIVTMFLGRVAPATLLSYLNTLNCDPNISYPDSKISLT